MRIDNVHSREIEGTPEAVGSLLDSLSSPEDRLWPTEHWPAMRFDRPLEVGADGGHGPIRYAVEAYTPSESVVFRFKGPKGLSGVHRLDISPTDRGATLTHTIDGAASPRFVIPWKLVFEPLHDALTEDALDNAERAVTGEVSSPAEWSRWVRLLRWVYRRR